MQNVTSLPTHVPTLPQMLIEQQHMIETLRAQLQLALRRQFGPRHEYVDIDQLGLFAGAFDPSTVIELNDIDPPPSRVTIDRLADSAPPARKKAVRILKDLPRQIIPVDIPAADKACSCCGARMQCIGVDSSEHLGYEPATIRILVTERKKYACESCHGEVKRAAAPHDQPLAKSMASASLVAFLIVSKFADGLPLYRIATRLQRLGIDLSHGLMSDWLVQCAELLEDLHARMMAKVISSATYIPTTPCCRCRTRILSENRPSRPD